MLEHFATNTERNFALMKLLNGYGVVNKPVGYLEQEHDIQVSHKYRLLC